MPVVYANGINLYYEEQGSGEPLLLIMGITAPGSVWEKHIAYWKENFRCISFDNRGVGQSDKPEGEYTTAQMADDCAALLDALGIGEARVAGVSMGSTIAQQLALRHPAKVRSLVLMCPWARCDNMAKAIFQHMVDCKAALPADAFTLFIQQLIFSKATWDNEAEAAAMAEGRVAALTAPEQQPLHGLKGQAAACINHDVYAQLPSVKQSTLVIGGKADIFTPVWMAEEVAGAIPNAELFLYNDCGHAFHWEQLNDFNERVRQWLLNH